MELHMRTIPALILGAALCLGLIILTIVLIFFALRRGTRVISQGLKERVDKEEPKTDISEPVSANTRWARGDLKAVTEPPKVEIILEPCPACGGENPKGASVCAFCGRKL
jgi:hypothetical protein